MGDAPRRGWLREPLVHFLVSGALLFVLYGMVERDADVEVRTRITVDAAVIDDLRSQWIAVWARTPTEAELRRMVDDYVREDVLYREALALDLDRDDAILRRRMIQKMRFLAEDIAQLTEPAEGEIATYFTRNAERYRAQGQITFAHAFFNPETRGENLASDVIAARERLRTSDPKTTDSEGDRFLPGYTFSDATPASVTAIFGEDFAKDVFDLPAGEWSGPVQSGFGPHLVRVDSITPGHLPDLSLVRDTVVRDLIEVRSTAANEALFAEMQKKYDVRIDEAALAATTSTLDGSDE